MTAILSPCGLYRYRLERQCCGKVSTAIIMVNPSTADAERDDATIRKLRGFGDRQLWGRLIIGNVFAYRSTAVRVLNRVEDPVGPENMAQLADIFRDANRVVFAWGPLSKLPKRLRTQWRAVYDLARSMQVKPEAFFPLAADGHPKHPLMLSYGSGLFEWRPPQ